MKRKHKKGLSWQRLIIFPSFFFLTICIVIGAIFIRKHTQTTTLKAQNAPNQRGYEAKNGTIYHEGNTTVIHGINWYGFESYYHVVEGFYARPWKDIITQLQSLGFNAFRIPICPDTINEGKNVYIPNESINHVHNSDLKSYDQEKIRSLKMLDKLLEEFNRREIYFILDHHVSECITKETASTIPELWYSSRYTEEQWIADLQKMAKRYKHLKYFMGIDLKNEPHGKATWGTNDPLTDWKMAAEKAGKAILNVNSSILIFVEGIGEYHKPPELVNDPEAKDSCFSKDKDYKNPPPIGGNLRPQDCYPIAKDKIPKNKLVFSPHIYGPFVTQDYPEYFKRENGFPDNMKEIWERDFGYLTTQGYTVIPGEWGSYYDTSDYLDSLPASRNKTILKERMKRDKEWMDALINYFIEKKMCSSFYWAVSPTSELTGGVLDKYFKDEVKPKMDAIRRYFNTCTPPKSSSQRPPRKESPTITLKKDAHEPSKEGWCTTYPNIPAPGENYYWEADCGSAYDAQKSCYNTNTSQPHSNCPKNTDSRDIGFPDLPTPILGYVNRETSNWCYGFSGPFGDKRDFRCLMLHHGKRPK